jgi:hypothetical protein
VSAASAPPKARIAQVSSATDTTPVRIFWPGMAYELRIDAAQLLVAEAVLLGRAGAEVLAEDVGPRHELVKDRAALRHFDLDHVGAEIGHQHIRRGPRLSGGTGDDLDALQRAVRCDIDAFSFAAIGGPSSVEQVTGDEKTGETTRSAGSRCERRRPAFLTVPSA